MAGLVCYADGQRDTAKLNENPQFINPFPAYAGLNRHLPNQDQVRAAFPAYVGLYPADMDSHLTAGRFPAHAGLIFLNTGNFAVPLPFPRARGDCSCRRAPEPAAVPVA